MIIFGMFDELSYGVVHTLANDSRHSTCRASIGYIYWAFRARYSFCSYIRLPNKNSTSYFSCSKCFYLLDPNSGCFFLLVLSAFASPFSSSAQQSEMLLGCFFNAMDFHRGSLSLLLQVNRQGRSHWWWKVATCCYLMLVLLQPPVVCGAPSHSSSHCEGN